MEVKIELPITELDQITKKMLKSDLQEYKHYILPEAVELGDKQEVKRIKKLIKAYKLILKDNYKYVQNI